MTVEYLADTWQQVKRRGAPGIDRETYQTYHATLDTRLPALHAALRHHRYRAPAVRRVYIPKPGQPTTRRPLGIPTGEDRWVQARMARLLSAIYEADLLPGSYGFRAGRKAHGALRTIWTTIMNRPIR